MVQYKCELCNYITIRKSDYSRHLNTKKHLSKQNIYRDESEKKNNKDHKKTILGPFLSEKETILGPQKDHFCEFCAKMFKNKTHLYRHQKHYCRIARKEQKEIIELKNEIEENKKERNQLYQYIEKLIEKTGDTINIENQTTNNQMNQMNQITLNTFGNEDISHITDSFKMQMLKLPYGMVQKMIEKVHFNKNKPENKNIALTNKRDKMVKVLHKNGWKYKDKDSTFDEIIKLNYYRLDDYYEEIAKEKLNENHNKRYKVFQKKFDEHNDHLMNQLKHETEMIILSDNLTKK